MTQMLARITFLVVVTMGFACQTSAETPPGEKPDSAPATTTNDGTQLAPPAKEGESTAIFAGGCFWCMEGPFEKLEGVSAVLSGYTAGPEKHPKYRQVAGGATGHAEAVIVYFDPKEVSYDAILDTYWRSFDPTDAGGQFADRGRHYRPGIFVANEVQRAAAQKSKDALQKSGHFKKDIVVPIEAAQPFWVAEAYHQDYYKRKPGHYDRYREGSGRAAFLRKYWGEK
jgi:methionine-S-sulfoxide reductase